MGNDRTPAIENVKRGHTTRILYVLLRGQSNMRIDRVVGNERRWTLYQKCGILWIPATMNVVYLYVSASLGGCRGICERTKKVISHSKSMSTKYIHIVALFRVHDFLCANISDVYSIQHVYSSVFVLHETCGNIIS